MIAVTLNDAIEIMILLVMIAVSFYVSLIMAIWKYHKLAMIILTSLFNTSDKFF